MQYVSCRCWQGRLHFLSPYDSDPLLSVSYNLIYRRGRASIQLSSLESELLTTHVVLLPQKRPHLLFLMEIGWQQKKPSQEASPFSLVEGKAYSTHVMDEKAEARTTG